MGCHFEAHGVDMNWEALWGRGGDSWGSTELGQTHGLLKSWNLTGEQDLGGSQAHLYPHFTTGENQKGGWNLPRGPMAQATSLLPRLLM